MSEQRAEQIAQVAMNESGQGLDLLFRELTDPKDLFLNGKTLPYVLRQAAEYSDAIQQFFKAYYGDNELKLNLDLHANNQYDPTQLSTLEECDHYQAHKKEIYTAFIQYLIEHEGFTESTAASFCRYFRKLYGAIESRVEGESKITLSIVTSGEGAFLKVDVAQLVINKVLAKEPGNRTSQEIVQEEVVDPSIYDITYNFTANGMVVSKAEKPLLHKLIDRALDSLSSTAIEKSDLLEIIFKSVQQEYKQSRERLSKQQLCLLLKELEDICYLATQYLNYPPEMRHERSKNQCMRILSEHVRVKDIDIYSLQDYLQVAPKSSVLIKGIAAGLLPGLINYELTTLRAQIDNLPEQYKTLKQSYNRYEAQVNIELDEQQKPETLKLQKILKTTQRLKTIVSSVYKPEKDRNKTISTELTAIQTDFDSKKIQQDYKNPAGLIILGGLAIGLGVAVAVLSGGALAVPGGIIASIGAGLIGKGTASYWDLSKNQHAFFHSAEDMTKAAKLKMSTTDKKGWPDGQEQEVTLANWITFNI